MRKDKNRETREDKKDWYEGETGGKGKLNIVIRKGQKNWRRKEKVQRACNVNRMVTDC